MGKRNLKNNLESIKYWKYVNLINSQEAWSRQGENTNYKHQKIKKQISRNHIALNNNRMTP